MIVLVASRSKMDVPRFLVCNLAMADFCMGLYLGFLAVVDAATLGDFRRFAIDWQFSAGCQVNILHTIRKCKKMAGQNTFKILLLNDANMIGEH